MKRPDPAPTISVGLPVYNGERYLRGAIESILNQTYKNFELIISDNASTDQTGAICRDYAARDPRIRYFRQPTNIGAAPNFNAVVHRSKGEFFRWQACDDISLPTFLEKCLIVLQNKTDPVAIAYPRWSLIDENGELLDDAEPDRIIWRGGPATERYEDLICTGMNSLLHHCIPVYGLMRRDLLTKTGLLRSYASSDKVFIVELALHGDLRQIPETLFLRRKHPGGYIPSAKTQTEMARWMDSSAGNAYPMVRTRIAMGTIARIFDTPLSLTERLTCLRMAGKWFFSKEYRVVGGEVKRRFLQATRVKQYD